MHDRNSNCYVTKILKTPWSTNTSDLVVNTVTIYNNSLRHVKERKTISDSDECFPNIGFSFQVMFSLYRSAVTLCSTRFKRYHDGPQSAASIVWIRNKKFAVDHDTCKIVSCIKQQQSRILMVLLDYLNARIWYSPCFGANSSIKYNTKCHFQERPAERVESIRITMVCWFPIFLVR